MYAPRTTWIATALLHNGNIEWVRVCAAGRTRAGQLADRTICRRFGGYERGLTLTDMKK